MGFRFRKSFGKGPFRMTISKSGVGYSIGGKGARFTKKAGGGTRSTLSIPGTGISYVKDSKKRTSKKSNKTISNDKQGHSIILHFLFGGFLLWIPAIYYSFSEKHYWHI